MEVAAMDRLGRLPIEVLDLLRWLRENGVEIVSL
jgi:DNA invertase Pin-like site-specific DNA recombinase